VKFALALLIAVHFWGDRHVPIPCHPVAVVVPDEQLPISVYGIPAAMATYASDCRILISASTDFSRPFASELYCADVVHEVGHIGGLAHSPGGIMAAREPKGRNIPYYCRHVRAFRRTL
jgi:hypothetical protein